MLFKSEFLIFKSDIKGIVNAVSPDQITFQEFNHLLHKMLKPLLIITIPGCILKLIFGEGVSVFMDGQSVIPKIMQRVNFVYRFPNIYHTLKEIIAH